MGRGPDRGPRNLTGSWTWSSFSPTGCRRRSPRWPAPRPTRLVRRSRYTDFQADGAVALAGRLGRAPRDIAQDVIGAAVLDDVCGSVAVSGPGFINLVLADAALGDALTEMAADDRLGVARRGRRDGGGRLLRPQRGQGDARRAPAQHDHRRRPGAGAGVAGPPGASGQNHIGDWGTPFGMLIEHLLDVGEAEAAHELSVGDLDALLPGGPGRSSTPSPDFRRARPARGWWPCRPATRDAAGCGGCWSTSRSGYFGASTTGSASC